MAGRTARRQDLPHITRNVRDRMPHPVAPDPHHGVGPPLCRLDFHGHGELHLDWRGSVAQSEGQGDFAAPPELTSPADPPRPPPLCPNEISSKLRRLAAASTAPRRSCNSSSRPPASHATGASGPTAPCCFPIGVPYDVHHVPRADREHIGERDDGILVKAPFLRDVLPNHDPTRFICVFLKQRFALKRCMASRKSWQLSTQVAFVFVLLTVSSS